MNVLRIVKCIGAWVCLVSCCVFLGFSVATNLILPVAAIGILFSLAPDGA